MALSPMSNLTRRLVGRAVVLTPAFALTLAVIGAVSVALWSA